MAHNWMEEVACTVKDVQNGINSLRNIKYIKSKLIVDGPAITNALNWHIWSNNYNLINFIYSASSINKYEKEYNSALRDLKLYAPKVLRHSEIGFKTKLSILLRTFFPMHPFLTPSLKITSGEISEKGQQERSGIEQLNRTERYR